jgi:diadenosine tetraphosphatase ApaH/serine/threonine PP2A family protein phosphatase
MVYLPRVLGLLYDVHGNLPALDAVLADAREQGADRWLLGGDYALFGAWPAETVARLHELGATWIRGNGERWTADPGADDIPADGPVPGAIAACREVLGDALVGELAALDEQVVLDGVRYCHASPVSDMRSFFPEPAEDEAELLADVDERRVVFGHTHVPFARSSARGIELVNPGSVGMPFDGDPRAAYALVHDDGRVQHRRVGYDHAASAAALRERFAGDWTEVVAGRIERAAP